MKKLEAAFDRAAFLERVGDIFSIVGGRTLASYFGDTSSEENAILELAKTEVEAYKNAKSAIDGACPKETNLEAQLFSNIAGQLGSTPCPLV